MLCIFLCTTCEDLRVNLKMNECYFAFAKSVAQAPKIFSQSFKKISCILFVFGYILFSLGR